MVGDPAVEVGLTDQAEAEQGDGDGDGRGDDREATQAPTATHAGPAGGQEGSLARPQRGGVEHAGLGQRTLVPERVDRTRGAVPLGGGGLEAVAGAAGLPFLVEPDLQGQPAADQRLVGDLVDGAAGHVTDDEQARGDQHLERGALDVVAGA